MNVNNWNFHSGNAICSFLKNKSHIPKIKTHLVLLKDHFLQEAITITRKGIIQILGTFLKNIHFLVKLLYDLSYSVLITAVKVLIHCFPPILTSSTFLCSISFKTQNSKNVTGINNPSNLFSFQKTPFSRLCPVKRNKLSNYFVFVVSLYIPHDTWCSQ